MTANEHKKQTEINQNNFQITSLTKYPKCAAVHMPNIWNHYPLMQGYIDTVGVVKVGSQLLECTLL